MRTALTIAALACVSSGALAAASKCILAIKGVAVEGGQMFLNVRSNGDLDGDFVADEAIVRLQCAGGDLRAAHFNVTSARSGASRQAPGFVRQWRPATPQLAGYRLGYDVRQIIATRMKGDGSGWKPIDLSNGEGLCAAVQNGVATRSRSNS